MSNQSSSIAFLSLPDLDGVHDRAQVVFGRLPTSVSDVSINLHGPFDIWVPASHHLQGRSPKPVFEDNRIIWVVNNPKGSGLDGVQRGLMWNSSVLRIGKYFTLKCAEHIAIPHEDIPEQMLFSVTSIIPWDDLGSISASCLNDNDSTRIVQKVGDSWKATQVQAPCDAEHQRSCRHSKLLNDQSSSNKTIYHISTLWDPPNNNNCYLLDTISSSMFSALHRDYNLLWRRFMVCVPTDVKLAQPHSLLTHNNPTTNFWLCTFFPTEDFMIIAEYLRLRKDGSVPSYESIIQTTSSDTLFLYGPGSDTASDLCVLHWDDKMLLTWNQSGKAMGKIGTLTETGEPQKFSEWKDVKFEFDSEVGRISECGVIFPSDFAGWEGTQK